MVLRTADRVTFLVYENERYDPDTSEEIRDITELDTVPCHVSDLGLDRSMKVFGDYKQSRKVVRLERRYSKPFDVIRHLGKLYRVVARRLDDTVLYIERDSVGDAP